MFKDKGVRIIIKKEENEFGDFDYVGYFHAGDIAQNIGYEVKHIYQWSTRWNIVFVSYENLVTQNELPNLTNIINDKRTDNNANFLSEQELKKVMLKVNTPESNTFQDWILRQSTLTKTIFKYIIQIKHQIEIDKLQQKLQKQIEDRQNTQAKIVKSIELFKKPVRKSGVIYIATSPHYLAMYRYKIGLTTSGESNRESSLQTSNPEINIVYSRPTNDVNLAENLIHSYLSHLNLNANKEFYYISSFDNARKIVDRCVDCINWLVDNFDDDYQLLQSKFIEDLNINIKDQQLVTTTIEPVNRGRTRSKSPTSRLINTLSLE